MEKVFRMELRKVYPLLVAKAERKGRSRAEVDAVTCWLTGYSREDLPPWWRPISPMGISSEAPQPPTPIGARSPAPSAG